MFAPLEYEKEIICYRTETLYDLPPATMIKMPERERLISSCDDFVVEVVIIRPWRSMILYWLSGAVSI